MGRSCWLISPSTTSIFIFLAIEKLIEFVTHLSGEDQQGTLPALVMNTLRVPLEKLVQRAGRKLPLGSFKMPPYGTSAAGKYPSSRARKS
jgi:hypothetical protein